jgi:hypothetical protein
MEDMMMIPLLGMIFFWAWVVYAIMEWRKTKYKNETQNKIIEKFNNVSDLNAFLQSEGGNKFLNRLSINGKDIRQKILSSMTKGVIILFLGIAIFVMGSSLTDAYAEVRGISALGIIITFLGLGFLVSTFISYLLSKKWGIFDSKEK